MNRRLAILNERKRRAADREVTDLFRILEPEFKIGIIRSGISILNDGNCMRISPRQVTLGDNVELLLRLTHYN